MKTRIGFAMKCLGASRAMDVRHGGDCASGFHYVRSQQPVPAARGELKPFGGIFLQYRAETLAWLNSSGHESHIAGGRQKGASGAVNIEDLLPCGVDLQAAQNAFEVRWKPRMRAPFWAANAGASESA